MSLIETIRRRPFLAIALLAFLMALAFQGSRGLWDPDEGRYTNVALQMLRGGDLVTLYRHHESMHFTKPPVAYWAMAASMATLGHNEWAARLPMALAFALTVLMVFQLGRTFVPDRPWLPALVYLCAPVPYFASNTINTDTMLAATETLALLCYVKARFAGGSPRWIDGMWAAFGLAFLTKGPPSLLPLLAILVFQFGHPGKTKLLRPLGLAAFALVGVTWFVVVCMLHPGLFDYFVGHEVVARIASDELDRHPQWYGAFLVYGPTLLVGLLPWLPVTLWQVWKRRREDSDAVPAERRFLWFWLLIPMAAFFLARSRLPLYLLPLFVPMSLLAGRALAKIRIGRIGWTLVFAWLLVLVGCKWLAAQNLPGSSDLADGLRRNNARNLAEQIQPLLPGTPREIIFIEDKTRYGLHLYIGAEIEKVGFKPFKKVISDAEFDKTVAESLREPLGGRIYIFERPNDPYFKNEVAQAGRQAILLGVLVDAKGRADRDTMLYALAGDFPDQRK